MRALLACGANAAAVLWHSRATPLYVAADAGRAEVVAAMLAAAPPSCRTARGEPLVDGPLKNGATPCYVAAERGHTAVVHALADARADLDRPRSVCRDRPTGPPVAQPPNPRVGDRDGQRSTARVLERLVPLVVLSVTKKT